MGIERGDLADAARREVEQARVRLSDAAGRVTHEAISAGSTISALVLDELDRRGGDLGDGLQHIADKMRGMVGTGDSEPPRVVQQAVDLIDGLSHHLRHQSARDLRGRVARFGHDNPATFIAACLATGLLMGRVLIAQGGSADPTPHQPVPSEPDLLPGDGPGTRPASGPDAAKDLAGGPVRDIRNG